MPSTYKDGKLIVIRLRELHAEGKLDSLSEKLLFAPTRPAEELYLFAMDRWQIDNLAGDPAHAEALQQHREFLEQWIEQTGDPGAETPTGDLDPSEPTPEAIANDPLVGDQPQ